MLQKAFGWIVFLGILSERIFFFFHRQISFPRFCRDGFSTTDQGTAKDFCWIQETSRGATAACGRHPAKLGRNSRDTVSFSTYFCVNFHSLGMF